MPITYDETRLWTYWLRVFTPSDIAEVMGVPVDAVRGHLVGLQFNGTIEDTGDQMVNGHGPEPVLAFIPLPPGPTDHHTWPPEWQNTPGVGELAPPNRGMPVRIRSERMMRKILSTSGAAAKHRQREKRYQKMQEDQAKRKADLRARQIKREQSGMKRKVKHKGRLHET